MVSAMVAEMRNSQDAHKWGLYCVTDGPLNDKHGRDLVRAAELAVQVTRLAHTACCACK